MLEAASDNTLRSPAAWAAKHMRKMDWRGRHNVFDKLWNKPLKFRRMIAAHFGPDEPLEGTATGSDPADIIVVKVLKLSLIHIHETTKPYYST